MQYYYEMRLKITEQRFILTCDPKLDELSSSVDVLSDEHILYKRNTKLSSLPSSGLKTL